MAEAMKRLFECHCVQPIGEENGKCKGCWKSRGVSHSVSCLRPCESGHSYAPFAFSKLRFGAVSNVYSYRSSRSDCLCSLLACRAEKQLELYDVQRRGSRLVQTLADRPHSTAHRDHIAAISTDSSGTQVYTVACGEAVLGGFAVDRKLKRWDLQAGSCLHLGEFPSARSLCVLEDNQILVGNRHGLLYSTNVRGACRVYSTEEAVVAMARVDSRHLVTCSQGGVLQLCDVRQLSSSPRHCVVATSTWAGRERNSATGLAFADGRLWLADSRGRLSEFAVDPSGLRLARTADLAVGLDTTDAVYCMDVCARRQLLLLASNSGAIKLVSFAEDSLSVLCCLSGAKRSTLHFIDDTPAVVAAAENGVVRVWSAANS